MRHLAIVGAALAALGINLGNAEAASVRLEGVTTSGFQQFMSVTTVGIRRLTTEVGIHRTPPLTVTTATRFVSCSACGQKPIGREA